MFEYESCYASLWLFPMQVYTFRCRSMTYMIYANLWPLSQQDYTFRFGIYVICSFMQVVTLAYASFRCRTSFTHASSPLCLNLVLSICMLWCLSLISWVRLFESNVYFTLNERTYNVGQWDNIKRFNIENWHKCLKWHKINLWW